jgi:hypothetical protein
MAMQLIDEGESVGLIALLDTPNPALKSNLSVTGAVQFHKAYLIDRLKKYCRMLHSPCKRCGKQIPAHVTECAGGSFIIGGGGGHSAGFLGRKLYQNCTE